MVVILVVVAVVVLVYCIPTIVEVVLLDFTVTGSNSEGYLTVPWLRGNLSGDVGSDDRELDGILLVSEVRTQERQRHGDTEPQGQHRQHAQEGNRAYPLYKAAISMYESYVCMYVLSVYRWSRSTRRRS